MKKWLVWLCAAMLLCAGAGIVAQGESAAPVDFASLQTGDTVLLYYVAGGAFVGEEAMGNKLGMVAADPADFDMAGVAAFTVTVDSDGVLLQTAKGYLTSGATGNSLAYTPEASDLSKWVSEPCGVDGAFYLRNVGAFYGSSPQYLEYYSGAITTYGLRTGGDAYIFAAYAIGAADAAGQKAAEEKREYPVNIAVINTGDLHGRFYHTNYTAGKPGTAAYGLTRLATLIGQVRAEYPDNLLIDAGDTIQGTPLTYYYCFNATDKPDPAVAALRHLRYDAWVLGNHEFNYGLEILGRQIAQAKAPGDENGGRVPVLSANLIQSGTEFDPWTGEAYIIREFPYAGGVVKVGVLGLTTPNIPNWERAENYAGIDFESFVAAWNHYAEELRAAGCDIVIAACHAGREDTEGGLIDGEYYEWANQVTALATLTRGIDLVIGAHTHELAVATLPNLDGEDVTVINAGYHAQALGVATIGFDPATGDIDVSAKLLTVDDSVAPDAALTAALDPFEDACWRDYMSGTLGVATADFEDPGNMTQPSAFLDLVNAAQLTSCYDKTGYTATTEDDVPPMMSITAPLTASQEAPLPKGDITMARMFGLYRYENWLYTVEMTAAEIDAWLEYAAERQYGVDPNGAIYGGGIYCDCLYGDGVSYAINLSAPVGERVNGLSYLGKELDQNDHETLYTVVINNYRYTGGGSYCKAVYQRLAQQGIPSDFVVYNPDTDLYAVNDARQVFSTQYGMDGGEDRGQARNLIAQYIRDMGEVTPEVVSTWRVTIAD